MFPIQKIGTPHCRGTTTFFSQTVHQEATSKIRAATTTRYHEPGRALSFFVEHRSPPPPPRWKTPKSSSRAVDWCSKCLAAKRLMSQKSLSNIHLNTKLWVLHCRVYRRKGPSRNTGRFLRGWSIVGGKNDLTLKESIEMKVRGSSMGIPPFPTSLREADHQQWHFKCPLQSSTEENINTIDQVA